MTTLSNYKITLNIPTIKQLDLIGGEGIEMGYKKVESSLWTPKDKDEELEGVVMKVVDGSYGKQYQIKTEDGKVVLTPSHKVLQDRMLEVEPDMKVKLVYLGAEPSKTAGKNPTQLYDGFIDVIDEEKVE